MGGSYKSLGRSAAPAVFTAVAVNIHIHTKCIPTLPPCPAGKHPYICIRIPGPHNTLWRLRSALRVAEIHANVEAHREIHAF